MRHPLDGAVAQLGERVVRNDEVRGSIPLSSTNGGSSKTYVVSEIGHRKMRDLAERRVDLVEKVVHTCRDRGPKLADSTTVSQ